MHAYYTVFASHSYTLLNVVTCFKQIAAAYHWARDHFRYNYALIAGPVNSYCTFDIIMLLSYSLMLLSYKYRILWQNRPPEPPLSI